MSKVLKNNELMLPESVVQSKAHKGIFVRDSIHTMPLIMIKMHSVNCEELKSWQEYLTLTNILPFKI